MGCYGFGCSITKIFNGSDIVCNLNSNNDTPPRIFGLDVHTVEFVIQSLLITLTLKKFFNSDFLTE